MPVRQKIVLASVYNSINIEIYFYRNGNNMNKKQSEDERIIRYADMFAAIGTEARLRIMRFLLSAHPQGMIVGDIQTELGIPNSTLSHHLEKLRSEGLVKVRRQGPFLWHTADADALREILSFLYAECCTRNKAVKPEAIVEGCC
jgi:ArsR family transcriptional regulator